MFHAGFKLLDVRSSEDGLISTLVCFGVHHPGAGLTDIHHHAQVKSAKHCLQCLSKFGVLCMPQV